MVRWLNTSFQFSRDFKAETRTLNGYPANDCKSQSLQDLDELWTLIALVLFSFNFLFYSSKEWQVTCVLWQERLDAGAQNKASTTTASDCDKS